MNQDEDHLRLLSIFHYVCAGLAALFACIPIFHLVIGLMVVFRSDVFGPGKNPPPAFIGWMFIIMAGGIILLGWTYAGLLAWAGRCLSRRVNYSFCLVMAAVSCMFMPFGTVLGVFTLIVLTRSSVKILFQPPPQIPLPA